ncbi:YkvA family protein [Thermodesulfobacteriota bacterium]
MGFQARAREKRPHGSDLEEARGSPSTTNIQREEMDVNYNEFKQSKWVRAAQEPQAISQVLGDFPGWMKTVGNSELIVRARRLKNYLTSGRCSKGDMVLVIAALLYLISPVDLVPDFIPVVGWLDDLAVAGMILGYLDKRAAIGQELAIEV